MASSSVLNWATQAYFSEQYGVFPSSLSSSRTIFDALCEKRSGGAGQTRTSAACSAVSVALPSAKTTNSDLVPALKPICSRRTSSCYAPTPPELG